MEEDIDIYADLPSFDLKPVNNQACNCVELKKQLSSLTDELKNTHKINKNLEKNLASLLQTAKLEIERKDKMIDELRKELDNIAFRRNNSKKTHKQHTVVEKHKNVIALMHLNNDESKVYETEMYQYEYESKEEQNDINEKPVTVFGERLQKRIMEEEKEDKRQKATLKFNTETDIKKIPQEGIMESDKENGSQFSVNNANESNTTTQNSNSGSSYSRNSEKRSNNDNTCRSVHLKTENNKGKTTDSNDYTMHNAKDDFTEYAVKDNLPKFEDRLDTVQSSKRDQVSTDRKRRAASEHEDTKQNQNCTNGWRREEKTGSAKDNDDSCTRKRFTDNLKSSRSSSKSNEKFKSEHQHDYYGDGYRKNGYRCNSPSFKSYSRSRSDYETYCLREKSSRAYRDRKYDDYKYSSRYRSDKLKRDYDSKENDSNKMRYSSREHGDLRDRSRYSSSDIEDRESRSNSNKYSSRRMKETAPDISNNRKLSRSDKIATEIDFQASSNRTIVNTIADCNIKENAAQNNAKNESYNISAISRDSTSINMTAIDTNNLEDGEILDSPEKKNSFARIPEDKVMEKKIVPVENENTPANTFANDESISLQNDLVNTNLLEKIVNVKVTNIETASSPLQINSKDSNCKEVLQLNSCKNDATVELHSPNNDKFSKFHSNENLTDPVTQTTIKQMPDSGYTNDINENLEDSSTESATMIEETNNFDNEHAKNKEMDNTKSAIKVKEVNNFNNDDGICKTDDEELTSANKNATKIETVLICDIKNNVDKISHQISSKTNVKMSSSCLSDHNYVRETLIDASDLDVALKPAANSKCKVMPEIATPKKEMKVEETTNVQSVSVRKTPSSTVKNKKEQQDKTIVISRRRKAVTLSDSNASMTIMMNTNIPKTVNNSLNNNNDSVLKPRACKMIRICKGGM